MDSILMKIYEYYTGENREMLLRAYDFAKDAHRNQKRASGEPYFIHPCAVAEILIELGLDADTIASQDIRVIIIKLADRLHNMRSLNFLSEERQRKMSRETLDIYAPIAGRLGISQIKCELEDLCLKYLEPAAFEYLVENIHQKLEERNRFVDFVVEEINGILTECNIRGEVFGRIHKKWKPMPGRIKDYIAMPKPNLYQSLHTTVVTNFGQPFEIQIRTEEMHRTAEFGIAAHWKYKEQRDDETSLDQRISWIREVMEVQGGLRDSKEFIEAVKGALISRELLVFTPQGKVISLPEEATPVDFAYSIHTEVGNHCTGAKVNGKIVPLDSTLEVGDVVEIITSPNSKGPSRDWLKFIKSSSARAKIKSFYKKEMKEDNIRLGRSMLEETAKRKGVASGSPWSCVPSVRGATTRVRLPLRAWRACSCPSRGAARPFPGTTSSASLRGAGESSCTAATARI